MPRFSANISTLFTEHDVLDRFAAARDAGFEAVEMQFPYDLPLEDLVHAKRDAGVDVVLINLPGGDFEAGDRGLAGLPDRMEPYRLGVPLARVYAEALGCRRVNVLAGVAPEGADRAACQEALIDNLSYTATEMDLSGIRVLVEAINDTDIPGFLINSTAAARAAIDRAGHPNLALQCDIYHMTIMGEDPAAGLREQGTRVGHIQFADAPGRGEPGTGDVDFEGIFATIDEMGYQGWVGAEYVPSGPTDRSLTWHKRFVS